MLPEAPVMDGSYSPAWLQVLTCAFTASASKLHHLVVACGANLEGYR